MNALPEGSGENDSLWVSIHQWDARAKSFPLTFNFCLRRGRRGGLKLITVQHFYRFIRSRLRHLDLYKRIHLRLWSDVQFPALETVILRDIFHVHDESAVLFLQSGPAGQAVSSTENTPCHLACRRSPFSPSRILTSSAHLQPLRMTGAHLFSNAHDIAISGSTFYMANTEWNS